MKKISLIYLLIFSTLYANAQSYDWIKGGGSTEGMNPAQSYRWEKVTNMCTDNNGNLYTTSVVGSTDIVADTFHLLAAHNTAYSQVHVLFSSYRCDGTMRWSKLIESSNDTYIGRTFLGRMNYSLAYDHGSVYMVGAFSGYTKYIGSDTSFSSNTLSFTLRYDTSGQFKWIRFIGPDSALTSSITGDAGSIAVDGQGYIHNFNAMKGGVHLIPLPFSTDTTAFYFTYDLKYDSIGNLISANRVHCDSLWLMTKVAFDKNDNKFYSILIPDETYWYTYYSTWNSAIAAFHSDGTQIWIDTTGQSAVINNIYYNSNNSIYLCGQGNDSFSIGGITVADTLFPLYTVAVIGRLDTNGSTHWIYNLQSNHSDGFSDITALPNGNIAALGGFYGIATHGISSITSTSGEMSNPLLLIVDSFGNTINLDQFHGPGNDDAGYCITSDAIGNIYAGGMLEINMSATGLSPYTTHGGNTDFFIAKYGYNCACTAMPASNFTRTGSPTASFTYTGSSTMLDSVVWHFGDGGHATGITATHTYTISGFFHPCVTVYTECGSDTYCDTITIGCIATPVAHFTRTGSPVASFIYTGTTTLLDSVVWNFGDGSHAIGLTTTHTYTANGTFHPCATVYTNCGSNTYCDTITVNHALNIVQYNSIEPSSMQVYPNPAQQSVTISYNFGSAATTDKQIAIYDMYGRIIAQQPYANASGSWILQLNNLAAGSYLVRMEENGHTVQVQHLTITH